MGWRDLLQEEGEQIALPWIGGRSLRHGSRVWRIEGKLPAEHGWYRWNLQGRSAELVMKVEPEDAVRPGHALGGNRAVHGYLIGYRFVSDDKGGEVKNPAELVRQFERVHLIYGDIDHFARVSMCRWWDDGPPIYAGEDFPVGPEDEVRDAFLDCKDSVDGIAGVPPALDLAFRMKTWHRAEVERRREMERLRREEEEKRERFAKSLGDGAARREMAKHDFEAAARAAITIGGAELIECRPSTEQPGEHVVRYRLDGERFECVCDSTMHIIDSGVCLQDHDTGEKGDTYFTLESLPGVVREAMGLGVLHVWRRW